MILSFDNISKQYNDGTQVLKHLSGEFKDGVYLVLGENGVGKTTFLKILVDLLVATNGEVVYQPSRPSIGYMGQNSSSSFYEYQTVLENLEFFCNLNEFYLSEEYCIEMLDQFNLGDIVHKRFYKLSGGQKQLVTFLRAFLHEPDFVVLDEPFNNMDPKRIAAMCNFVAEYVKNDKLVVFSSHTLEQISKIYDGIYYIREHHGFLIKPEDVNQLTAGLEIIEVAITEMYYDEFLELCETSSQILVRHQNSKTSHTLLVKEHTILKENDDLRIFKRNVPTLSNLHLVLDFRGPDFIKNMGVLQ